MLKCQPWRQLAQDRDGWRRAAWEALIVPDSRDTEKQKEEEEEEGVRQNYQISWPGIENHPPPLVISTSPWKPGFDLKLFNVRFIAVFSGHFSTSLTLSLHQRPTLILHSSNIACYLLHGAESFLRS